MRDFLRSELLRSRSGLAMIGVASFALLIPVLLITVGPPLDGLRDVDDERATRMVFGLIASIGIVTMYLGSYAVSREHYYGSMSRSLVMGPPRTIFVSKILASVIAGAALCLLAAAVWAPVSAFLLADHGRQVEWMSPLPAIVAGALVCAVAGAVIGVSLGWIVRNYYVVSAVVLLIPLMIELPLLFTLPSVERFLPVGAFAGVTGAPIEGLLPWGPSALVLGGWCVLAVAGAAVVARRREQ